MAAGRPQWARSSRHPTALNVCLAIGRSAVYRLTWVGHGQSTEPWELSETDRIPDPTAVSRNLPSRESGPIDASWPRVTSPGQMRARNTVTMECRAGQTRRRPAPLPADPS